MNDMLVEYWEQNRGKIERLIYNRLVEFCVPDFREFTVVDGEEGDFGIIKYRRPITNALVAIKTVHGGDDEEVEFTEHGKIILKRELLDIIREALDD